MNSSSSEFSPTADESVEPTAAAPSEAGSTEGATGSKSTSESRSDVPVESGKAARGSGSSPGGLFDPQTVELGPFELSGLVSQRYRYRRTGAGEDQDLYGFLSLVATHRPAARGSEGRARIYRQLSLELGLSHNVDIDAFESAGAPTGDRIVPFLDATNTFGDRFHAFLHSAAVVARDLQLGDLGRLDTLRVGRQSILRDEAILFDGGFLRTARTDGWSFDVYGGLPAHLYESSPRGDAFGGASVDWAPSDAWRLGLDGFYLRDERRNLPNSEDFVTILRGDYRPDSAWTLRGTASWNDTRERRQTVEVRYLDAPSGLVAHLRLRRQNAVVDFLSSEISPYVLVQGRYAPYYQAQIDLDQELGEHFSLGGGALIRELEDSDDAGRFNHSFRNAYLSLGAREFWPGFAASVRGDAWDADGEDIYTVGAELEQRFARRVRARVGTSYSLYRFDAITGEERHRDRIYYARIRWTLWRGLDFDTDYQYERDSITEYHTVITGLRIWF